MTILNYGDLVINGETVKYEGRVKIKDASIKTESKPQTNGGIVIISNIEENFTTITVPVRSEPETNRRFDKFKANGDNNIIKFRDKNYSRAHLMDIPEREDQEIVEYVFQANPSA